jgi:hypothetical protein
MRRRRSRPPSTGRSSFPARGLPIRDTGSPGCRPSGYLGGAAAGGSTTRSPTEAPCRPVASRQHDRRHSNSNPPNNFGLVSPKTHQATQSVMRRNSRAASRSPCAHEGRSKSTFATFGPGRARPEIQKSHPFFQPISSPNTEKQRLTRSATDTPRKDFWTVFPGPLRSMARSKFPRERGWPELDA